MEITSSNSLTRETIDKYLVLKNIDVSEILNKLTSNNVKIMDNPLFEIGGFSPCVYK